MNPTFSATSIRRETLVFSPFSQRAEISLPESVAAHSLLGILITRALFASEFQFQVAFSA
jgi:hypothetical protein